VEICAFPEPRDQRESQASHQFFPCYYGFVLLLLLYSFLAIIDVKPH